VRAEGLTDNRESAKKRARVGSVILFWFASFLFATINFDTTILLCVIVIGIGCACQQLLAISADFEKEMSLTSERICE
jgi:hypothetical protein